MCDNYDSEDYSSDDNTELLGDADSQLIPLKFSICGESHKMKNMMKP